MIIHARSCVLGMVLILIASCAPHGGNRQWTGPETPVQLSVEPWTYADAPATTLRTSHYLIRTTVADEAYLRTFAQTMEGAYGQYRKLSPGVRETDRPMECFVFATRSQWSDFTRAHTGADANLYLQIPRGAYAVGDWYVAYYLGDSKSLAIASHEGFHQYVARNFVGRIPPFLEEGTACLFESVTVEGGLPRWNMGINLHRAQSLREAVQAKAMYPLSQLIRMHAGNVIQERGERIEAFYGQSWAFARFLWDGDGGRYRPAFQRLLADAAAGTVYDPTGFLRRRGRGWNPDAARPMLERYLGMPLGEIEGRYQAYVQEIAFKRFGEQWGS